MNQSTPWEITLFETALFRRLQKDTPEAVQNRLRRLWENTRDFLVLHVLEKIGQVERDLSDHGPRHIANVLDNAYHLLHRQDLELGAASLDFEKMNPYEAYVLGLSILYHDVGNLFGRAKHNQRIQEVFTEAHAKHQLDMDLRTIVHVIASAHTGASDPDGKSPDTIQGVDRVQLWNNQQLRAQELAAILRFADELAEGPQRASILRLRDDLPFETTDLINERSRIYHEYAKCLSVNIDRAGGRILLNLRIDVEPMEEAERDKIITEILGFFWQRLYVLNQERQYGRYYSSFLEPFKAVSVTVEFFSNGRPLKLSRQHTLNDLRVPQKPTCIPNFEDANGLETASILAELTQIMGAGHGNRQSI